MRAQLATSLTDKQLSRLVEKSVRDWFKTVNVTRVEAYRDISHCGDDVLRIWVVHHSKPHRSIDSALTVPFAVHLISVLHEHGEEAFPMLHYISESDYKIKQKHENRG